MHPTEQTCLTLRDVNKSGDNENDRTRESTHMTFASLNCLDISLKPMLKDEEEDD